MKSITYGELSFQEVCDKVQEYTKKDLESEYIISVGTDSQNIGNFTKVVSVITLVRKTKGGIFFYDITKVKKIKNIRQKILTETQSSIDLACKLVKFLNDNNIDAPLEIHIDIGEKGETKDLIKEIAGWVMGLGFKCRMKPDSYSSSGIADKISKRGSRVG
ncbi:ribonuclease H-like YkuK family protein [Alkaliphilus transvaalensis]|uniref:ribonuclease H-like YkuK family protein n=1 Tax=Alkaliphilus transvaalensis TaxID=114628 RepID=UPI000478C48E|nr:ribonuclease H-like YkuK family protein [Alkaliphilus transvaalensis]